MSSSTDPIHTSGGTMINVAYRRDTASVVIDLRRDRFRLTEELTAEEAMLLSAKLTTAALQAENPRVKASAEVKLQQECDESLASASIVAGVYDESRELLADGPLSVIDGGRS